MNYYLKDGTEVYAYDDHQVNEQGYPVEPMTPITEEEAMDIVNSAVPVPL